MLKEFGRGENQHLIKLVAIVRFGNAESYMLFPWADCDLASYFLRYTFAPEENPSRYLAWLAAQMTGLADAVRFIHDPKHLNPNGEQLYGRHGDIKPENILWFRGRGDPEYGILVLSDLGISAVHRDNSKSSIPNKRIENWTPGYQPPELSIDGNDGNVERSFDIWSLGCVFLEMLVWYLDGWKDGVEKFKDDRKKEVTGDSVKETVFYSLSWEEDGQRCVFGIKKMVYQVKGSYCYHLKFFRKSLWNTDHDSPAEVQRHPHASKIACHRSRGGGPYRESHADHQITQREKN